MYKHTREVAEVTSFEVHSNITNSGRQRQLRLCLCLNSISIGLLITRESCPSDSLVSSPACFRPPFCISWTLGHVKVARGSVLGLRPWAPCSDLICDHELTATHMKYHPDHQQFTIQAFGFMVIWYICTSQRVSQ